MTRSKFKIIAIAVLGTVLEYYDYSLYGFLAVYLAQHFFPVPNPLDVYSQTALLQTWAVFAAASLAKPLGALWFGRLGDTRGRMASLRLNMWGIAIPTALIGILPGYHSIGLWAVVALFFCRILQGICLGGEYDGVTIYVLEHMGQKRPGLANSMVILASSLGISMAAFAGSLVAKSGDQHFSWRLPFIVGGVFGLVVLCLRRNLAETPEFTAYLKKSPNKASSSFKSFFKTHWRFLMLVALLCGSVGGSYHFYFVFLNSYLHQVIQFWPQEISSFYLSMSLLIYTCSGPIAGLLSDKIGPKKTLLLALFALIILIMLHVYGLAHHSLSPSLMLITAFGFAFFHVPGNVFLLQHIPVERRYRLLSLGHTLGSALLSGSTPAICLFIWQNSQQTVMPFYYLLFLLSLALLAILRISRFKP